jgi:hypothetical protein
MKELLKKELSNVAPASVSLGFLKKATVFEKA